MRRKISYLLLTVLSAFLLALAHPSFRDAVNATLDPRVLRKGFFTARYDLDATTMTYCASVGADGTVWDSQGIAGDAQVDNASSSTTITDTGTGHPFTNVAVGDLLLIDVAGVLTPREVIARADEDGVTVDEAIDLSAADYDFTYRDLTCGTASTSGWVYVGNLHNVLVTFNMPQYTGDGNGIDVRFEGAQSTPDGYWNPTQLYPIDKTVGGAATVQNLGTAGIAANLMIYLPEPVEYVRFGMMHNTADDGTDTTTDAEQITVIIVGEE
jgi:hypothetical protein